jgi:hypothetical protein
MQLAMSTSGGSQKADGAYGIPGYDRSRLAMQREVGRRGDEYPAGGLSVTCYVDKICNTSAIDHESYVSFIECDQLNHQC